jgi:predicted dinucleotide-binding enzyme
MHIGIIGAGRLGGTLGTLWARHEHDVLFSYSRDAQKLARLARDAGPHAQAGDPGDALQFGEVIFLAVPWGALDGALAAARAGAVRDTVLLDGTNPFRRGAGGLELVVGHTTSGSEEIARRVPGARVVKAFSTLGASYYAASHFDGMTPSIFIAGDDAEAKTMAARLGTDLGLDVVDAGALASARLLEPLALLVLQMHLTQPPPGPALAVKLLRRG